MAIICTFFLGGFRVRYIYTGERKDKVLWKETNKGPDSIMPYFIIPDKESDDTVPIVTAKMETDIKEVMDKDNPLQIEIYNTSIPISCRIKHTHFDRSLIEKISGLGGALCTLCKV